MARVIRNSDLPENLQELLEEYADADEEMQTVITEAKEENPEMFEAISQAQANRNALIDRVKTALKEFVEEQARDDPDVVTCHFGDFRVTPKRQRGWDDKKFRDLADELGIYDECVEQRIIIPLEAATVNVDRARELDILSELIDDGVISLRYTFEIDGGRAEDLLSGEQFARLRSGAWEERLLNASCNAPKPSLPL